MQLTDTDFALFDLPERQQQDAADITARWKALAAQVHPDRFVAQGAAAQRMAMQWAVRVNEAHQRLRDPLARARYLCELRGAPIGEHDNTAMPAAFLMEQMAWREALDDVGSPADLAALSATVAAREAAWQADLIRQLDVQSDALGAAQTVRALMFVARLRRDLRQRADTFA